MAELKFSLRDTLLKLLDEKRYYSLRDLFNTMNPADIATVFEDIDEARLPLLFRLLPKELAAETFVEMQPEQQERQGKLIRLFKNRRHVRRVHRYENVPERGVFLPLDQRGERAFESDGSLCHRVLPPWIFMGS